MRAYIRYKGHRSESGSDQVFGVGPHPDTRKEGRLPIVQEMAIEIIEQ